MKKNLKDGDIVRAHLVSNKYENLKRDGWVEEARLSIEDDTVYIVHNNKNWDGDRPRSRKKRYGFELGWLVGYILNDKIEFDEVWIEDIKLSNNNKYLEDVDN